VIFYWVFIIAKEQRIFNKDYFSASRDCWMVFKKLIRVYKRIFQLLSIRQILFTMEIRVRITEMILNKIETSGLFFRRSDEEKT